jgi:hypothetical protein
LIPIRIHLIGYDHAYPCTQVLPSRFAARTLPLPG